MNLRNLKIFCEVYRTGSVTKTAENLYLSQPAVSRALHEMEEEYQIRLFERFHKRLIPTAMGKAVYDKAVHLLKESEELEQQMKLGTFEDEVRIGATAAYGIYSLPRLVSAFQKSSHNCRIRVLVAKAQSLEQALLNDQIDLAVIEGQVDNPDLVSVLSAKSPMSAVCASDSRIPDHLTLSQLSRYPLLLREKGSASRRYVEALFTSEGISVDPLWESESTQALIHASAEHLGVAVVPSQMAEEMIHDGKIREIKIEDAMMSRNVYAVYHKDKYLTENMKRLLEMAEKNGKKDLE